MYNNLYFVGGWLNFLLTALFLSLFLVVVVCFYNFKILISSLILLFSFLGLQTVAEEWTVNK